MELSWVGRRQHGQQWLGYIRTISREFGVRTGREWNPELRQVIGESRSAVSSARFISANSVRIVRVGPALALVVGPIRASLEMRFNSLSRFMDQ
jgi:hypothetical protein